MPTNESAAAPPRRASTVVVARDCAADGGIEVLLIQRHAGLRFMGGVYVFPGGAVQASDEKLTLGSPVAVPPPAWPHAAEASFDRAHAMAAVRETFEEVGLLLGAPILDRSQLQELRKQALSGVDFGALLASARLKLDLGALIPLIRWVTPSSEPIRFDTRFYVAAAPKQQIAEHDARECVALQWLTPSTALEKAQRAELVLAPPTKRTLQEFEQVESVEALLQHARRSDAPTVEPVVKEIDGVRLLLFPGDPAHPVATRALSGPTRVRI